jgi:general secretion pathway protein B
VSYILDALRRAERERERGQVPGLSAQAAPSVAATVLSRPRAAVRGLGLALAVALAGGLAWWLWPSAGAPTPVPPTGRTAAQAAAPAADVPPPASEPPADPAPLQMPPAQPPLPAPLPAPLPVVVSAPRSPPPLPAPVAAPTAPPAPPPPHPSAASPDVRAAATPSREPRALTLAELTPQQRREWPPLALGGAVHSDSPASRFIIVNGQLVREGEEAAPGVTVERIGLRAATLRWRDLRVELPY